MIFLWMGAPSPRPGPISVNDLSRGLNFTTRRASQGMPYKNHLSFPSTKFHHFPPHVLSISPPMSEGMLRHDLAMNAPNRSSYDTIRVLIRLDVLSVHTIAYACSGWWRFADILLTILSCLWVSSLTIPPKIVAWRFGGELLLFEVIIRRSDEQERSTGWLAIYKHVIFCFVWWPDANSKNKRDFLLF